MRAPVLILAAAIGVGTFAVAVQVAFMAGLRFRLRRVQRITRAGRRREAERVLVRLDRDCTAFRARHPAWVRA